LQHALAYSPVFPNRHAAHLSCGFCPADELDATVQGTRLHAYAKALLPTRKAIAIFSGTYLKQIASARN